MNRRNTLKLMSGAVGLAALTACAQPRGHDIVDIAAGDPEFSTLVAAVQAAGFVDMLKGAGPLTVFAPTNVAFGARPAGTVENLLLPENKAQLFDILTYNVVPGQITSSEVLGTRLNLTTM